MLFEFRHPNLFRIQINSDVFKFQNKKKIKTTLNSKYNNYKLSFYTHLLKNNTQPA